MVLPRSNHREDTGVRGAQRAMQRQGTVSHGVKRVRLRCRPPSSAPKGRVSGRAPHCVACGLPGALAIYKAIISSERPGISGGGGKWDRGSSDVSGRPRRRGGHIAAGQYKSALTPKPWRSSTSCDAGWVDPACYVTLHYIYMVHKGHHRDTVYKLRS